MDLRESARYALHGVENQCVIDSDSGIIINTPHREEAELLRDQLNSYEDRLAAMKAELDALKGANASLRESLHYANGVADVNIADNERHVAEIAALRSELAVLRERADKAVRACCHAAHRTHDYATWCSGCSEVDDVVLPGFLDAKEGGR